MAKKVFFSFHYQDVKDFRANVVRNHGNFKLSKSEAGFYDSSIWEEWSGNLNSDTIWNIFYSLSYDLYLNSLFSCQDIPLISYTKC